MGTALIAKAVNDAKNPPSVLVSGSAIGYYGSSETATFSEHDPAGSGFLADVCEAWEAAAAPARIEGTRVATIRTGIVLSTTGGTLKKLIPLFKIGAGGKLGSGKQWMSWIHIDDQVGAIMHLLNSSLDGPVNLTAPNPVTNAEFTKTFGEVVSRPTFLPIPKFGPKLLLGSELSDNLLFSGQKVIPAALETDGFVFAHPTFEGALRDLLKK